MRIAITVELPRRMRGSEIIEAVKAAAKAGADGGRLYLDPPREGLKRYQVGRAADHSHQHVLVAAAAVDPELEVDGPYERVVLKNHCWGDLSVLFCDYTDEDVQKSVQDFHDAFIQQLPTP